MADIVIVDGIVVNLDRVVSGQKKWNTTALKLKMQGADGEAEFLDLTEEASRQLAEILHYRNTALTIIGSVKR